MINFVFLIMLVYTSMLAPTLLYLWGVKKLGLESPVQAETKPQLPPMDWSVYQGLGECLCRAVQNMASNGPLIAPGVGNMDSLWMNPPVISVQPGLQGRRYRLKRRDSSVPRDKIERMLQEELDHLASVGLCPLVRVNVELTATASVIVTVVMRDDYLAWQQRQVSKIL